MSLVMTKLMSACATYRDHDLLSILVVGNFGDVCQDLNDEFTHFGF